MPRLKPINVLTWAPKHSAAGVDEVWEGIRKILTCASHPARVEPVALSEEIRTHVLLLADGEPIQPGRTWPLRAAVAFSNLASAVHSGHYRLRRCRECDQFFLTKDARRVTCRHVDCQRATASKRAADSRAIERARAARVRVALKSTKRTR